MQFLWREDGNAVQYSKIAQYYDLYADADYDLRFWELIARAAHGSVLELMCGTGRIIKHLRERGYPADGLERDAGMLETARMKTADMATPPVLYCKDATDFQLEKNYDLIFIAFQSIAEVVDNCDKKRVFDAVQKHLTEDGSFWLTIHNPAPRLPLFDGSEYDLGDFHCDATGEDISIKGSYSADPATGIVSGTQNFTIDNSKTIAMPVRFHLIQPEELEQLLDEAGFEILTRYGDYDCTPWRPQQSTFLILECALKE